MIGCGLIILEFRLLVIGPIFSIKGKESLPGGKKSLPKEKSQLRL